MLHNLISSELEMLKSEIVVMKTFKLLKLTNGVSRVGFRHFRYLRSAFVWKPMESPYPVALYRTPWKWNVNGMTSVRI